MFATAAHPSLRDAVYAIDLDSRQIVMSYPMTRPGVGLLTSTPDGAASCTYRLDTGSASFTQSGVASASSLAPGVAVHLTTGCAWEATTAAPWVHLSTTTGTATDTVIIGVDANQSGVTRKAAVTIGGQIVTVTQAGPGSQTPFGVIDSPQDGAAGISGAIAITGWALDDVGVDFVDIFRDPMPDEPQVQIPIGNATFVDGARPDVQAAFPSLPFASRAGWGYQLLTNVLPNGGTGTYRLHVYAHDIEGHTTFLGSRTIVCNNSTATLPFGALDTPGQGESVSGTITNWGWALAPQPANIPTDGTTIDVVIDGVVVGHPVYGLDRSDIATLFPGYANTHSAVGRFTIDTTAIANGVHTIAWVVRDSLGRAQGIGSRYFTVFNP